MPYERLQKLIARSGLCSRRDAEQMIREGRVTVNGSQAVLGDRADADRDHIKVDGKRLKSSEPLRYILLYKPREVMTTCDPSEERTTVIDLLGSKIRERVYPVGRLDYQSEGLLLLTNDGEFAARVAHPRHGVVREYLVKVRGDLTPREQERLLQGATIDGRRVRPLRARRESVTRGGANSWWRVEVGEGRTHEVRELFFRAGHHVQRLRRTAIGPLRDESMRPGDFRFLTEQELDLLRATIRRGQARRPPAARAASSTTRPRRSRRRASDCG